MQQEINVYTYYTAEISCTGKSQGLAYLKYTGASPREDYLQDMVPPWLGTYSSPSLSQTS